MAAKLQPYLDDQFTPGMDDHPELEVRPPLSLHTPPKDRCPPPRGRCRVDGRGAFPSPVPIHSYALAAASPDGVALSVRLPIGVLMHRDLAQSRAISRDLA